MCSPRASQPDAQLSHLHLYPPPPHRPVRPWVHPLTSLNPPTLLSQQPPSLPAHDCNALRCSPLPQFYPFLPSLLFLNPELAFQNTNLIVSPTLAPSQEPLELLRETRLLGPRPKIFSHLAPKRTHTNQLEPPAASQVCMFWPLPQVVPFA